MSRSLQPHLRGRACVHLFCARRQGWLQFPFRILLQLLIPHRHVLCQSIPWLHARSWVTRHHVLQATLWHLVSCFRLGTQLEMHHVWLHAGRGAKQSRLGKRLQQAKWLPQLQESSQLPDSCAATQ